MARSTSVSAVVESRSLRDEHGVSAAVRGSSLAQLLDSPMPKVVMHLRVHARKGFDRAFCGEHTQALTDAADVVACPTCKAEVMKRHARAERAVLKALSSKGAVSIRDIARDTLWRLEAAGQVATNGARVSITDAGRARLNEEG